MQEKTGIRNMMMISLYESVLCINEINDQRMYDAKTA